MSESRRILCIDDDVENLKLLKTALERDGYFVITTTSGEEALDRMDQWNPDLVLLDRNMPVISGPEVLKKLRSQANYTSVIFVSADATPNLIADCLLGGADDYVKKPFSFVELLARIKVRFRFKEVYEQLQSVVSQLKDQTERDFLTGLYNMRNMYDKIDSEIGRSKRYGGRVGCVMIDMDNFKLVNDKHDHLFGSYVLKEVGGLIRGNMRDSDMGARYGGDEFLIVVLEPDVEGIKTFCERLRKKIEMTTFQSGADSMRLTTSLGYCLSNPKIDADARTLVRLADRALYEAKAHGRNCVVGYDSPDAKPNIVK